MALVDVYGLQIPQPLHLYVMAPAIYGFTLDAAGEKLAAVTQAPKTGNIRKVHCRVGPTVTTATDTDIRLETVDVGTGNPSGTLLATNSNVVVAAAGITANAWLSPTLTADAPVTRGQMLAVVIAPSGTPNFNMSYVAALADSQAFNPTYSVYYLGSWGKMALDAPIIALEYDDGSFAYSPGPLPITAIDSTATISTGSPDERALRFSVPAPVRLIGVWFSGYFALSDVEFVLYDADGTTELAMFTMDKDMRSTAGPFHGKGLFETSQLLAANTFYRISARPTSGTDSIIMYSLEVNTATLFDAMAGGQNFHYSERSDAGAWTDVTTKRPFMGLIIDGIELPDQGSGLQSPHFG